MSITRNSHFVNEIIDLTIYNKVGIEVAALYTSCGDAIQPSLSF